MNPDGSGSRLTVELASIVSVYRLLLADDRPEPASSQRTIQHRRLACSKIACFTKRAEFDEQYACCERVFRAV